MSKHRHLTSTTNGQVVDVIHCNKYIATYPITRIYFKIQYDGNTVQKLCIDQNFTDKSNN